MSENNMFADNSSPSTKPNAKAFKNSLAWFEKLHKNSQDRFPVKKKTESKKPANKITTPGFSVNPNFKSFDKYECPEYYINTHVHCNYMTPLKLSNGDIVYYDISQNDLNFLKKLKLEHLEEDFIRIVNLCEILTGSNHPISFDAAVAYALGVCKECFNETTIGLFYQYWLKLRTEMQQPLIRGFREPSQFNNDEEPIYHVFQNYVKNQRILSRRVKRTLDSQASTNDILKAHLVNAAKVLESILKKELIDYLKTKLRMWLLYQREKENTDHKYVLPTWHLLTSRLEKLHINDLTSLLQNFNLTKLVLPFGSKLNDFSNNLSLNKIVTPILNSSLHVRYRMFLFHKHRYLISHYLTDNEFQYRRILDKNKENPEFINYYYEGSVNPHRTLSGYLQSNNGHMLDRIKEKQFINIIDSFTSFSYKIKNLVSPNLASHHSTKGSNKKS